MSTTRITCGILLVLATHAQAEHVSDNSIRSAVASVLPWLEKASQGATDNVRCFTCHHHALPILALVEAKRLGFPVDQKNLDRQLAHTLAYLSQGQPRYKQNKGQEGQVLTAGYALWCLQKGAIPPDETTQAVAQYLLNHQSHQAHWTKYGRRPPADGSDFSATFVALKGLQAYSPDSDQVTRDERFPAVQQWLLSAEPQDTEDAVFRLKSLSLLKADTAVVQAASNELLAQQNKDGGWSQLSGMPSDAYATGTVLATLLHEGGLKRQAPAAQSGIRFLLNSQLSDGTWYVKSRAEAFQPYFESGFPYEKDQFLSITASSWAAIALLRSLPRSTQSHETQSHEATSEASTLRVP